MNTRWLSIHSTLFVSLALACACDVQSPHDSTGGVALYDASSGCSRALVITLSDYISTNVALSSLDGTTLSGSFVSTSASTPGLAFALSGDVVVPSDAPTSKRVVLLDRFGTNVITWLDPASAKVLSQLPVGTGFEANAQDYLEIDPSLAFVSRFGSNPQPGRQAFDAGGDLLIIDTKVPAIVDSLALPEADPALSPSPGAMTRVGHHVVVALGRISANFSQVGAARYVGIDPSTRHIDWMLELPGLKGCGKLNLAPSGRVGAVACSGQYDATTFSYPPENSDVVLLDLTASPPTEIRRLGLGKTLGAALQPHVVFASEQMLLTTTYGTGAVGDALVSVAIDTAVATPVLNTAHSYALGSVACLPNCNDLCFLADAERNVLHRFRVTQATTLEKLDAVPVETEIGLPPRQIGAI